MKLKMFIGAGLLAVPLLGPFVLSAGRGEGLEPAMKTAGANLGSAFLAAAGMGVLLSDLRRKDLRQARADMERAERRASGLAEILERRHGHPRPSYAERQKWGMPG